MYRPILTVLLTTISGVSLSNLIVGSDSGELEHERMMAMLPVMLFDFTSPHLADLGEQIVITKYVYG
jgi:hypothetical protein